MKLASVFAIIFDFPKIRARLFGDELKEFFQVLQEYFWVDIDILFFKKLLNSHLIDSLQNIASLRNNRCPTACQTEMVLGGGVEPPRLSAYVPETYASANFASPAVEAV